MTTPVRPRYTLELAAPAATDPSSGMTPERALALRMFRDLQAAGSIAPTARLSDPAPGGGTYEAALQRLVGDANGNGRLDVDVDALRRSGLVPNTGSNAALAAQLGGAKPPLADSFFTGPARDRYTEWRGCDWDALSGAAYGAQRLSSGMTLRSDLDERARASPDEARKVSREAVAGAQFLETQRDPVAARELLARSAQALDGADRPTEARDVYRELARAPHASASTPAGSADATYGALATRRIAEIDHQLTHLSPAELARFSPQGQATIGGMTRWIDDEIAANQKPIADKKARGLDATAYDPQLRRVAELESGRQGLVEALREGSVHGDALLELGNVVQNEAGRTNDISKRAIAYAWLNRTEGVVRAPIGQEISHWVPLDQRWANTGTGGKLTLLQQLPASLDAASTRLADLEPGAHDPTGGATHWVSPGGLGAFKGQPDRYARTVGDARDRAFPEWARDPQADAAVVASMTARGKLTDDYAEIAVAGVPSTDFLFYTGVKYSQPTADDSAVRP